MLAYRNNQATSAKSSDGDGSDQLSLEQARELLGLNRTFAESTAKAIKRFSKTPPQTLNDIIDFQQVQRAIDCLGVVAEERRAWSERVLEPLIFSTLRRWVYGACSQSLESPARAIDSNWVLLSTDYRTRSELHARIDLAIHICKDWNVRIPPAWLRDLAFFSEYFGKRENRKNQIDSLFEALRTRMYEQAIKQLRAEEKLSSMLKTEELAAQILNVGVDAIDKRRRKANKALGHYYKPVAENGVLKATPSDLIVFRINIQSIKDVLVYQGSH